MIALTGHRAGGWANTFWLYVLGGIALVLVSLAGAESRWGADYFPDVVLTTQDGAKVHFYNDLLKGKSVAINLFYTSCQDVCPLQTAKMVELQHLLGERMGKDIFFYSIAIDPWDTPKENKTYAQKFGVGPGWLFLSGKEADIQLVTRKLGLSRASDAMNKDGHTASLMVGNALTGQWMRHSSIDNPQFLAATIGNFLGWRNQKSLQNYAHARPLVISNGQFLFQSRCAACHTVGDGDRLGPDLLGVTARRERTWLVRYLVEPDKMRAEGDATATRLSRQYKPVQMPNLALGSDDVEALLWYLGGEVRPYEVPQAGQRFGK